MLTRREMLVLTGAGTAWAAAALSGRGARAAIAAQTPVNFDVPSGACDCHAHVFPDPARFPFTPNRVYTPSVATPDDLLELQRVLHLNRVVINQPSVCRYQSAQCLWHGQQRDARRHPPARPATRPAPSARTGLTSKVAASRPSNGPLPTWACSW